MQGSLGMVRAGFIQGSLLELSSFLANLSVFLSAAA